MIYWMITDSLFTIPACDVCYTHQVAIAIRSAIKNKTKQNKKITRIRIVHRIPLKHAACRRTTKPKSQYVLYLALRQA